MTLLIDPMAHTLVVDDEITSGKKVILNLGESRKGVEIFRIMTSNYKEETKAVLELFGITIDEIANVVAEHIETRVHARRIEEIEKDYLRLVNEQKDEYKDEYKSTIAALNAFMERARRESMR